MRTQDLSHINFLCPTCRHMNVLEIAGLDDDQAIHCSRCSGTAGTWGDLKMRSVRLGAACVDREDPPQARASSISPRTQVG